jgi:hypothetical protein
MITMRVFFLFTAIFLPSVALAAPRTFVELTNLVVNYINAGIGVALILGIVIYFYGITTGMAKTAGGKTSEASKQLMWGLIALFVMFSVWGILALLRNTLFSGSGSFGGGSQDGDPTCLNVDCAVGEL